MLYAAYDDLSIYAIGKTPEEAIHKARNDAGDPDAEFDTAYIGDDLAAWIERNGWNGNHRSFAIRNGRIIDTTNK